MKINYYLLTIFQIQPNLKQQTKQPPHNNRPKRLLLKASSYLSMGHKDSYLVLELMLSSIVKYFSESFF